MRRRDLLKSSGVIGLMAMARAEDLFRTPVDINTHAPRTRMKAEVRTVEGSPKLFLNGEPVVPMIYALTDCPGGRWAWEELPSKSIENFVEQGFRLFQVDVWLSEMWNEQTGIDLHLAQEQLRGVLYRKPDAAVVIRIHVNAPDWWIARNKSEWTGFADGPVMPQPWDPTELPRLLDHDLDRVPQASLASARWRKDAGAALAEFCRKLAAAPEGNCVIGMQPACGVFGEWHYWAFNAHDPDTGAAMTAHFRQWLREKYRTEEALQSAWGSPTARFETATVPDLSAREAGGDGIFRNPVAQRWVIDYFACQHEAVAQDIVWFCRTVKEHWPRPIVTGAFYNYYFSVFGREAAGGHLAPEVVLSSPFVDYLSGPQAYYSPLFRDMGCTGQSRGLLDACRLHGKLWLDEMDQEPHIDDRRSLAASGDETIHTKPEGIAILRRNVCQGLVHGMGLWFYDFGYADQSGWWNDPDLLQEIRKQKEIFDGYAQKPYRPAADVLVVYDAPVFYQMAAMKTTADLVSWTLANELSAQMYHSGVAFDQIYLSDLPRADLSRYRALVFTNTFCISGEQKRWIREHAAQNGRHLIWQCAPGYSDGRRLSAEFVSEITGIQVQRAWGKEVPVVAVQSAQLPEARIYCEASWVRKNPVRFDPFFIANDTEADIHGRLEHDHSPGLVSKRSAHGVDWYSSVPINNAAVLRGIFKQAEAHIYNDAGDVIHANADLLLVHTRIGGERQWRLPNGKTIRAKLPEDSTTLFETASGRMLLGQER